MTGLAFLHLSDCHKGHQMSSKWLVSMEWALDDIPIDGTDMAEDHPKAARDALIKLVRRGHIHIETDYPVHWTARQVSDEEYERALQEP